MDKRALSEELAVQMKQFELKLKRIARPLLRYLLKQKLIEFSSLIA